MENPEYIYNSPVELTVEFAGGGPILADQIKLIVELIKKNKKIEMHMIPGISAEQLKSLNKVVDCKNCHATDAFIATSEGQELKKSGKLKIWSDVHRLEIQKGAINRRRSERVEKHNKLKPVDFSHEVSAIYMNRRELCLQTYQ